MATPKIADENFNRFEIEAWFFRRLAQLSQSMLEGVQAKYEWLQSGTTWDMRKERARSTIVEFKIDAAIIGKNSEGKAETVAACFARLYGENLQSKKGKSNG
jgi:hypothetical protein